MHGRLKVKTTAQQQEEKRIEREKKAKVFIGGMRKVFGNRGCDEKEDESLKITEKLLSGNPDVYTLWNIRKEIFMNYQKRGSEELEKLFVEELKFLQTCLHVNPKSYGVWSHRHFVMNNMESPNWYEELQLCNMFLKYDERNFHCWDYRRFVVKQSKVSPLEELEFTMKKIVDNFSNYSAWHNRSKLLPLVHPDPEKAGRVDEPTLLKEFSLVQNAFFTDPNDQSAWFYQRWLLGRREVKPRLLSLSLHRSPLCAVASFSHPVNLSKRTSSDFSVNGEKTEMVWQPTEEICNKIHVYHSNVWISYLPHLDADVDVSFSFPDILTCPASLNLKMDADQTSSHLSWMGDNVLSSHNDDAKMFSDNHTVAKVSLLEGELESLNLLLEEEPDNKWTMLTIIFLMRALNGSKYVKNTEEMLDKLMEVDCKRKGYYKDLRSRYRMEDKLQQLMDQKIMVSEVDLSNMDLTTVYYGQYFTTCTTVNLRNNNILSTTFTELMIGVQMLILSNNNVDRADVESKVSTLPLLMNVEL